MPRPFRPVLAAVLLLWGGAAFAQSDPYRSQAGSWRFARETGERGEIFCEMTLRNTNPQTGPVRIDLQLRVGRSQPWLFFAFWGDRIPVPTPGADQIELGTTSGAISSVSTLALPISGARRMPAGANVTLVMHSVVAPDALAQQLIERLTGATLLRIVLPNATPVAVPADGFAAAWQQASDCAGQR